MGWIAKVLKRSRNITIGPTNDSDQRSAEPQGVRVRGDNPVRHADDDAFGRFAVARTFAQQLLELDASEGLVAGVLGPWGSGKTSFINFARSEFARLGVPLIDFNPWMFSGTEQLIDSFFIEIAAQLKVRPSLAEVGKELEDYGETFSGMAWLPVVGPWIERGRGATKILGKFLQRRKEGVSGRRATLENTLAKLDKPIVVILDDIDRLSTSEIRDVFRLVRLTASFPNLIYIVAFDRMRIEEALAEHGVPGRDYLEKILQLSVDLPALPTHVLDQQIVLALTNAYLASKTPAPSVRRRGLIFSPRPSDRSYATCETSEGTRPQSAGQLRV